MASPVSAGRCASRRSGELHAAVHAREVTESKTPPTSKRAEACMATARTRIATSVYCMICKRRKGRRREGEGGGGKGEGGKGEGRRGKGEGKGEG